MSFLDRLFGKKASADSAKERLQLVLIHDRTDLTPADLTFNPATISCKAAIET
jgi:cell division topological specificity factor MinE